MRKGVLLYFKRHALIGGSAEAAWVLEHRELSSVCAVLCCCVLLCAVLRCCSPEKETKAKSIKLPVQKVEGTKNSQESMKSSVVRNLEAPTPSLRDEAAARRQNVAVAAWSAGGLLVVGLLVKVLANTVGEVYVLLAAEPPTLATIVQPGDVVSSNKDITSDKVCTMIFDRAIDRALESSIIQY